MITSLAILSLLISSPPVADRSCDEACVGVLAAAVEWTVARLPEGIRADTGRFFLDTGGGMLRPGTVATPEIHAQALALHNIAAKLGIVAKDREEDARWVSCHEDLNSSACRAAQGTMMIVTVRELNFVTHGKATIRTITRGLGDPYNLNSMRSWVLSVERDDGVWRVTKVLSSVIS